MSVLFLPPPIPFGFDFNIVSFVPRQAKGPVEETNTKITVLSNAVEKQFQSISNSNDRVELLKQSINEEESKIVEEWFSDYNQHGINGRIGLVPLPLMDKYPTNAPKTLDPDLRHYVAHFYSWFQNKSLF
jgi:hypothetical protein